MDGREVEWQLACTDLGSVRRWLADNATIDGLVLEPRSTLQIVDTYLDTDDWRIHRAGFALRIRSSSGKSEATLKSLHSASVDFADRRELSEPLENAEGASIRQSNGPVGARVQAVSGSQALLSLFEARTSRQRFAIHRKDEPQQLGEIALDETVISRPNGDPHTSLQRVEVEALTAVHEPLRSLVKLIQNECGLEAAFDTKYARGLQSAGLSPQAATDLGPTAVAKSMSLAEVAQANLRRHVAAWHLHEPGARLGDDSEELHDLRLAARRLDAILRQFRSALPASYRRTRPALKKVLRALGSARDFDVALGELDKFKLRLPHSERESVEPLKQHLVSERDQARAKMLSVLNSAAKQKILRKLSSLLTSPAATSQQSSAKPALKEAPDLIHRRYRKVRKRADRLTPDSSTDAYHEVRSHVKKLRYALEAVAVLYGKPAEEMLRSLRRWQETLGIQQDAAVAIPRLQTLASAPPKSIPPATLFLMGRLAEQIASAAARSRKRYSKDYRKVRTGWKRLRMKFDASDVKVTPQVLSAGPCETTEP